MGGIIAVLIGVGVVVLAMRYTYFFYIAHCKRNIALCGNERIFKKVIIMIYVCQILCVVEKKLEKCI